MTLLELQQVRKGRGHRCVIWDASARLSDGIYLLEGANGAGKTTLLEVMCGLEAPTSGGVFLNGRSVHSRKYRGKHGIAMIPASAQFYDGASVDFAIRLYLSLHGAAIPGDVFECFDPFSLRDYARVAFGDLSLGWKKRLMLHMAFASDPTVLLLDEPTVGLDADGVECLSGLLLRRQRPGVTVFTCHEPSALQGLPLRQYTLQAGIQGSVLLASEETAAGVKPSQLRLAENLV